MAEKKIQWNKAQVNAIESRDGSVLVSVLLNGYATKKILVRQTACLSLPSPRPQQPK